MNVVMLLDNHNDIKRSKQRTLPRPAKEAGSSRSKSLSRKEEERQGHSKARKISTSTHQLTSARGREESAEVPVIVDDVTKWISGVNKLTTCRDVITIILKRSNDQFKVILRFLSVRLNTPIWSNC